MDDSPTPEALLDQLGWLRNLAQQLVSDPHRAEDLAQETCIIALERQPAAVVNIRHWLAHVMRNVMRDTARGDRRRRQREERVARTEAQPSTADLIRRASLQRDLATLLVELDEPYRTTLLMRFFEELPPRAIASRQGVPVNTVKTRLARGLDRLRSAMDDRHEGNRSTWMAALLPLIETPPPALPFTLPLRPLGVAAMKSPVVITLTGLALVGGLAAISSQREPSDPLLATRVTSNSHVEPALPSDAAVTATRLEPFAPTERVEISPEVTPESASAPAGAKSNEDDEDARIREVRGRVLLQGGAPLGGVPLRMRSNGAQTTSDAEGWFTFETDRSSGYIESASEEWVTVGAGRFERASTGHPTVVLARSIEFTGRVVDGDGLALPGAVVRIQIPRDFETRFQHRLDWTAWTEWSDRADENGHFALPVCPALSGATLYCHLDGYGAAEVLAPPNSTYDIEIVLERPTQFAHGVLRGRVLSPWGRAVEGARVAVGLTNLLSDVNGYFEIDLARAVTAHRITAVYEGFQPAVLEQPDAVALSPAGGDESELYEPWPDEVELVLGLPPLTLSGVVVDEDGKPAPGVQVWIDDPTPFGVDGMSPLQTEYLLAGGPVVPEAVARTQELPEQDGNWSWNRGVSLSTPSALWSWVTTDAHGRFEIEGLLDRDYRIKALDPETLVQSVSAPIRAGTQNAWIVLDEPVYRRLEGRVVDSEGTPQEGVRLLMYSEAFVTSARVFGGRARTAHSRKRDSVVTRQDGTFQFDQVPRRGIRLWLKGDTIIPRAASVEDVEDPLAFDIQVDVRCHVQVVLQEDKDGADQLSAHTASGDLVELWRIRTNGHDSRSSWPLIGGRSEVLCAPATAKTLILYKEGEVVDEIEIDLTPGQIEIAHR